MGHVVRDVADVGPEADHRGLVGDRRHAVDRRGGHVGIAHVALDPLRPRVHVVGPLAVGGGQQHVQHADVVAVVEQGVDDVGADEAGAAGDEDRARHGAAP